MAKGLCSKCPRIAITKYYCEYHRQKKKKKEALYRKKVAFIERLKRYRAEYKKDPEKRMLIRGYVKKYSQTEKGKKTILGISRRNRAKRDCGALWEHKILIMEIGDEIKKRIIG